MRINKLSNYGGFKRSQPEQYLKDIDADVKNIFLALQGRLRFGTGVDGVNSENFAGEFQIFTSSATPDAENTVAHSLGAVPIGFIVLKQDKAASLYAGSSAWTATNTFFKSPVASVTYTIFLLK